MGLVGATDPCFDPFILEGLVGLTEDPKVVRVLRDTGGLHSLMQAGILLFFFFISSCQSNVQGKGVEMSLCRFPCILYALSQNLYVGYQVAVCSALPIASVYLILCNEMAGFKVKKPKS